MKIVKMSLATALLVGSSVFAIDNVKVGGDARLYYSTTGGNSKNDSGVETSKTDLFNKNGASAQAAFNLKVSATLTDNVTTGGRFTVTDTLGLENNLVSGTWSGPLGWAGADSDTAAGIVGTQYWVSEAWINISAGKASKTNVKIGRMELDTPLAFSEKWNIVDNTFGALVIANNDLPDTTIVGAYVGQSNGAKGATGFNTVADASNGNTPFTGYKTYNNALTALNSNYKSAGGSGAYAIGIVNNSWKPLTAQAWYYNVVSVTDAYWLQADLNLDGVILGAQYTVLSPKNTIRVDNNGTKTLIDASSLKDSKAYAFVVGYEMKDLATVKIAYSSTDKKGALTIQNTATGSQTKLYTEAWWNYGIVGLSGTNTLVVYAEANAADIADVFAQYTGVKIKPDNYQEDKLTEITVGANKSFGPLDLTLAYIYAKVDAADSGNSWLRATQAGGYTDKTYSTSTIQAYLTLNF